MSISMNKVWKKHDDVIPDVLKGISNDCVAWKLVCPEGRDQVMVVSGCQLLQSGLGDVFLKVRMPKEIFHGSSIPNSMRLNCGR